ncbi:MAG: Gfo/Idh/MocA family oxidoreductase, partial [Candidatus Omnitrophica bacterium]|nr:Gfo/Idh/MocA family oxidoreductase [Candidatus Omnitrophota bacterium]
MKIYRTAVIGCGRIGSLFSKDPLRKGVVTHAAAYKDNSNTELVAACDINKDRLKEFGATWGVRSLYTNIKKMLSKEGIDIISICTPSRSHYAVLKESVKFQPKAVFCEKPLADSVKDGEKMEKLCKKNNILLQVGHQRRFDPLHINLRKFITGKKMGEVQQANFYYTAGVKNTGSHMFDLLRFFFGDAEWIEAFFSKNESGKVEDPNLDGVLKFKNGLFSTFQACDVKKYLLFELNCLLEGGRIILKDSGFSLEVYKTGESKYFSGYRQLCKTKKLFNTKYKRDFLANAVTHLLDCINKKKESVSSGKDGLAALKIIEGALFSADHDGKR